MMPEVRPKHSYSRLSQDVGGSKTSRALLAWTDEAVIGVDDGDGNNISALEALRNALYKFKTYLLTYLLNRC